MLVLYYQNLRFEWYLWILGFRLGIDDSLGIQKAMFEALDDVEKKMGAPLTYADADGMKIWQDTVDKINAK